MRPPVLRQSLTGMGDDIVREFPRHVRRIDRYQIPAGLGESVFVDPADNRTFAHAAVSSDRALALGRTQPLTSDLQHVIGAPRKPEEAVGVHAVLVAGPDPVS